MGESFITRRDGNGGGIGEIASAIAVTYPAGSTCTATNGTKTLVAKDTSGFALFDVEPGTWTVSCTDGSNNKSVSVIITAEGESHIITLKYSLVLFDNGTDNTDITGGWSSISNGRVQVSATTYSAGVGETSASATTISNKAIDFSGYSILKFYDLQTSWAVTLGTDSANVERDYEDSGEDVEIDISSVNTSAQKIWMKITAYSNNGYNTETASVSKIELI